MSTNRPKWWHVIDPYMGGAFIILFLVLGIDMILYENIELLKPETVRNFGAGLAALSIPAMWTVLGYPFQKRNELRDKPYFTDKSLLHVLNFIINVWQFIYASSVLSIFCLIILPDTLVLPHNWIGLLLLVDVPILAIILPISLSNLIEDLAKYRSSQTKVLRNMLAVDPPAFFNTLRELLPHSDKELLSLKVEPVTLVRDLSDWAMDDNIESGKREGILQLLSEFMSVRDISFFVAQRELVRVPVEIMLATANRRDTDGLALYHCAAQLLRALVNKSILEKVSETLFKEVEKYWTEHHVFAFIEVTVDSLMDTLTEAAGKKIFIYTPELLPSSWRLEVEESSEFDELRKHILNAFQNTTARRWSSSMDHLDLPLHEFFESFFPSLFLISFAPLYFITVGVSVDFLVQFGWKAGYASGLGSVVTGVSNEEELERQRQESMEIQRVLTYKTILAIAELYSKVWTPDKCDEYIEQLSVLSSATEQERLAQKSLINILTDFKNFLLARVASE